MASLPEMCFGTLSSTGETIIIRRFEKGFYPTEEYKNADPDELNELINVTKGQRIAMEKGSMLGWDVPFAQPYNYTDDGVFKRQNPHKAE